MKKLFCAAALLLSLALTLAGCDNNPPPSDGDKIAYTNYEASTVTFEDYSKSNETEYDSDLYYRNDLGLDMGDPAIAYENGYYYAYGTRGGLTFHCFRSTDLVNWEQLNDCFTPSAGSWCYNTFLWAPDVQKINGKWYLYYTGGFKSGNATECQLGVAISDTPYGPFTQYTGVNALKQTVTQRTVPFQGMEDCTILDSTVFRDDDGSLYMYFSYDTRKGKEGHDTNSAEIWGVKMLDAVTWDISTLTRLISPGYKRLSDSARTIAWETWSPSFENDFECAEGPYMIKNGGKYYLTYCANSFVDTEYAVGYAVGDSPLGDFVKPNDSFLQNMLLGVPGQLGTYVNTRYLGFMTGTGHASVFKAGDEYMLAYHAHTNRDIWGKGEHGEWRSLAIDHLYFDADGAPYTNGPTYALTAQPEAISGYKNLALQASVRSDGEGTAYLNDNYTNRAIRTEEVSKEATFRKGINSIEIRFASAVRVRAVNVYNSYDYTKKIDYIKQIDFGNGKAAVNALFNPRYVNDELKFIYPHAAFTVVLDEEIVTDKIIITFDSQSDFAVGEVEVLGRAV